MLGRRGFSRLEVLIGVGLLALLAAVLIPRVYQAREAALRSQSRGRLKQWGLAVHNYVDTFSRLPPGGWVLPDGTERHGWVTALLPYLDASPLYISLDLNKSWHDPRNQPVCRAVVTTATAPGVSPVQTVEGYGLVHYAVNASLMHRNSSLRFNEITAGLEQTLMIGQAAGEYRPWACPWNWRPIASPLNAGVHSYGHSGRDQTDFVLADGQVRTISNDIDPVVLAQLASGGLAVRQEDTARPPISATYPSTTIRYEYKPPRKGEAWSPPPESLREK